MIVLINGGPALDRFGANEYVGRLVSPRSGNLIRSGERWAGDNDAFKAWDEARFRSMLGRLRGVPGCLFVSCPDVVGDAVATLERFDGWQPEIAAAGFPVAFVGQDGAESIDLPWARFDAWFVGGSTEWKLSRAAADLVAEANRLGKWTHMGRVNTFARLRYAYDVGCDSVDGTGWSMFPDLYMKKFLPYVESLHHQHSFFSRMI